MSNQPVNSSTFPPLAWIGNGLDLTSSTPMDIRQVTKSITNFESMLKISNTGTSQTFNAGSGTITWVVPPEVNVSSDVSTSQFNQVSYQSGDDATSALQASAELQGTYMAVTVDASADYSIKQTFQSDYQYNLVDFSDTLLQVNTASWGGYLNDALLLAKVGSLKPWDPTDPTVVQAYKGLFGLIGTHIVTGATYGARFSMAIAALNTDSSVVENFAADISVAFNGLTTSGQINTSVDNTDQYNSFSNSLTVTCSCFGGDVTLAAAIQDGTRSPGAYKNFLDWVPSASTNPNVMNLSLVSLWEVALASSESTVNARSSDLNNAYTWILANPSIINTNCSMTIESDWAEIMINSPSTTISCPNPPDTMTVVTPMKLTWGKEKSHNYQRQAIDFVITNDGSPISFTLSHGSSGSSNANGVVNVTLGSNTTDYKAEGVTDNDWNSVSFFQCPLN